MGNMSYCRFENTVVDLADCEEHFDDILSSEERRARIKMYKICKSIVRNFNEDDLK